mmetsp:Transcript_39307/g.99061  ORF Transcript_39307/g.99061 Transcript_39307/m.99061 type:complete len:350 (-) Transcript_39307:780-1829(-)
MVYGGVQLVLRKAQHALALAAQLVVRLLVVLGPRVVVRLRAAVRQDVRAARNDALGRAFDHQHQPAAVLLLVDGQLVFVGGVEGDLEQLLVGGAHIVDASDLLHKLDDGRLGRVANGGGLQDGLHRVAGVGRLAREHGAVAQHAAAVEGAESGRVLAVRPLADRRVGGVDLAVEPQVRHRHAVLRERAGLVGADGGGGPQRLHRLQVLHQHVLRVHALGGQSEGDRHGGKQTLGHVGDNDTNHKHHVLHDGVHKQAEDKEDDAEDHGHSGDNLDEVVNLLVKGRLHILSAGRKASNTPDQRAVARVDNDAGGTPLRARGTVESQVARLERVVVCALPTTSLRLRLSSQG